MKIRNFSIKSRSFSISKAIEFIKAYSSFVLIFSLLSSGLIIGTLSVKNSADCRYLINIFLGKGNDFSVLFINRILPIILTLTINFIMGLCLVGTPFIYAVSFAEGIYFSLLYSFRLYAYGNENFISFWLSDVLFFVMIFVITALSQDTAITMSEALKNYYCNRKGNIKLKKYLTNYLIYLLVSAIVITIQALIKAI